MRAWVEGFGWAGPFLFMGLYALATLLFLPGSLLTLAGGAVFGLGPGTFYNLTGATVGAGLSFLAARHLLGDWVESKTRGRLAQLKQGVEREGWQFVAFVRLIPLFPFNLLNYALGLTRIRFWTYLAVTYLAMLPGAFVYTYIGVVGKNALAGQDNLAQIGPQALLALGLLALVIYLPKLYLARKSSKPAMMSVEELKEGLSGSELLLVDLRDEEDYRSRGFIPQGQNIPLARLRESMDGLLGYKEEPIALICTTSIRSFKAYELLRKEGFQKVAVVDGGIKQWSEKGFSLRSNQEDPA
ncbi:MAG: VTT domain-containing protein [Deltaproteobacteria bacterium]|nr:VTT domain-containing protein [Deltaproteobacteria bacterium]